MLGWYCATDIDAVTFALGYAGVDRPGSLAVVVWACGDGAAAVWRALMHRGA